jgi:Rps23 Pro-64 3,4-dihydroxylase Tpa1-like proline 4-hydroxylase
MVDRTALGAWIQPQHLQDDAVNRYREALQSHPAKVVVLEQFLVDKMSQRLTAFVTSEAQFKKEYGLYSEEGTVSEERWMAADDEDRFFKLGRQAPGSGQFSMSPNTLTYLKFRQTFQRPEFKQFFEEISGLSLGASDDFGVQSFTTGDFLRPHSDDNRDRRLALVLYLSPQWETDFGGALRMFHPDGDSSVIVPGYNSVVVFDVLAGTSHLVEPVTPAAGDHARLTIGGWYHKPD